MQLPRPVCRYANIKTGVCVWEAPEGEEMYVVPSPYPIVRHGLDLASFSVQMDGRASLSLLRQNRNQMGALTVPMLLSSTPLCLVTTSAVRTTEICGGN